MLAPAKRGRTVTECPTIQLGMPAERRMPAAGTTSVGKPFHGTTGTEPWPRDSSRETVSCISKDEAPTVDRERPTDGNASPASFCGTNGTESLPEFSGKAHSPYPARGNPFLGKRYDRNEVASPEVASWHSVALCRHGRSTRFGGTAVSRSATPNEAHCGGDISRSNRLRITKGAAR